MEDICLNLLGECCFDQTGCIYNDGDNTCLAEQWRSYYDLKPLHDVVSLEELQNDLAAYTQGEIILTFVKKRIIGDEYSLTIYRIFEQPESRHILLRDNKFWMKEAE